MEPRVVAAADRVILLALSGARPPPRSVAPRRISVGFDQPVLDLLVQPLLAVSPPGLSGPGRIALLVGDAADPSVPAVMGQELFGPAM
jgi:hypothetical protein